MKKLPTLLLLVILGGTALFVTADDKKEERLARKIAKGKVPQKQQVDDETIRKSLPPFPEITNAPVPEINRILRLSPGDLAAAAAKVDQHIFNGLTEEGQKINDLSSDEVFVRRIYVDIAGRIPTPQEAESFLTNTDPDKRRILIDELLVTDGYRSHQFNWYADMLRIKSGIKRADFSLYQRWLKDGLRSNRGWDETVYEMLAADGSLASSGATGYLMRDSGMPLDSLSNTLTLFLGANVSCAQCHDHPLAKWTQREFYEMAAFFGSTDVSSRDPRKVGNAIKNSEISKQDVMAVVAPNMYRLKNLEENELVFPEDYAYDDAKPGEAVPPMLVSWAAGEHLGDAYKVDLENPENFRESFATWMTHAENPRFAVNIANRLWQRHFGIAVKEPIEDIDDLSRASNPELLLHLAEVVVENNFDLREFQRILFNTKAYQAVANSTPPIGDIDDYLFSGPVLRRMTAEQAWDSILFLGMGTSIDEYQIDRSHKVTRMAFDYDYTSQSPTVLKDRVVEAKEKGYIKSQSRLRELDLVDPDRKPEKSGRTYLLRASELGQPQRDNHFLRMFGQSSRDIADDGSLEGNIPQTLMLMNGRFQEILTSPESPVMKHAAGRKHNGAAVSSLYRSFFSRDPSREETKLIKQAMDDGTTIEELAWTLFNTPEFLFIQ